MPHIVDKTGLYAKLHHEGVLTPGDVTAWRAALADPSTPLTAEQRALGGKFLDAVESLPVLSCSFHSDQASAVANSWQPGVTHQFRESSQPAHAMVYPKYAPEALPPYPSSRDASIEQIRQAWEVSVPLFAAFQPLPAWRQLCAVLDILAQHTKISLKWASPALNDDIPPGVQRPDAGYASFEQPARSVRHRQWVEARNRIVKWPDKQQQAGWQVKSKESNQGLQDIKVYLLAAEDGRFMGDNGVWGDISSAVLFPSEGAAQRIRNARGFGETVIVEMSMSFKALAGINKPTTRLPDNIASAVAAVSRQALHAALDGQGEPSSTRKARL